MEVLTYEQVLAELPDTKHLLLGNGFSIACDKVFHYGSLFEFAKSEGVGERVRGVFEHLGTNNFEGVLRLLEDLEWASGHYGLTFTDPGQPPLREDIESVKAALIAAVAQTHLSRPGDVAVERIAACVDFLGPYHNVFTTNYDLLLYWVEMQGLETRQGQDGFRAPPDVEDAPYVVFHEHVGGNKGIFFLHGALHLYVHDGEVRKQSWTRTGVPLIDQVTEALQVGQYPLFVAEGQAAKKHEQIQRSGYLSYCLGKLERIQNPLVVYGLSLGDSDSHIADAIGDNGMLEHVYIGLFDPPDTPAGQATIAAANAMVRRREANLKRRARGARELQIRYYDSKTAHPWG